MQLYSSFYLIDNDFEEQPTQSNTQEVNGVIDADGLPPEMPARFVEGNSSAIQCRIYMEWKLSLTEFALD